MDLPSADQILAAERFLSGRLALAAMSPLQPVGLMRAVLTATRGHDVRVTLASALARSAVVVFEIADGAEPVGLCGTQLPLDRANIVSNAEDISPPREVLTLRRFSVRPPPSRGVRSVNRINETVIQASRYQPEFYKKGD